MHPCLLAFAPALFYTLPATSRPQQVTRVELRWFVRFRPGSREARPVCIKINQNLPSSASSDEDMPGLPWRWIDGMLPCFTLLRGLHAVGRVFMCVLFSNKCPGFERFDPNAKAPEDQKVSPRV